MAKHPHKLLFINNQTWKCQLDGCAFFVHRGLQHVLTGKRAICWNCGEDFILDNFALRDDKPKCPDCRLALGSIDVVPSNTPIQSNSTTRTPEQQAKYEQEMAQMFGKDWRKLIEPS